MIRRPPRPTLFPYTTLFRSVGVAFERVQVQRDVFVYPGIELKGAKPAVRGGVVAAIDLSGRARRNGVEDRKSTRLNSSHSQISYAVFCLKKKKPLRSRGDGL